MISDELKGISILMDSTIKDVKEWEKDKAHDYGYGKERPGATATGITESCKLMRRMLLQIMSEVQE